MALPITSELVDEAAAQLAGGGWRYTPRQLYYASCAAAEAPPVSARSMSSGVIGFGIIFLLIGLIVISHRIAFITLLSVAGLLILIGLVERMRPRPVLFGRVLAISYTDFMDRFGTRPRDGLIDLAAPHPPSWMLAGADPIVVCDMVETAALVNANTNNAGLASVVAVHAASLPDPLPVAQVIALHDASPAGCALPVHLRDAGVDRVIDAGIRPESVAAGRYQVIEGAPARMPTDLSGVLAAAEIDWLRSGRRLEVAVFSPEHVLGLVAAVLPDAGERLNPDIAASG